MFSFALSSRAAITDVFSQIYDVSIASYWIMYALLTPAAAFALLTSYNLTFNSTGARLLVQFKASPHTYKKVGCESAKEFDAMVEDSLVGETSAWTFLFCNLCFSLTFAFLAFYVLRNVELPYSYCVSTAAAGALTYYLAFVTKVK